MTAKKAAKIQKEIQSKLLSLRNDAVFKLFFTREANIEQLRSFLKATTHLTDEDLIEIDILNPILTKEHVQDKDFVVDIRLKDSSGNHTHLEMQMRRHDAFIERLVAYNSRQYSSQLSRGENYAALQRSISLIITDFPMFDDSDEYFEYITYRRENRKIFTNAQEYFILDLTKLPGEIIDDKEIWGALFKSETEEELRALMVKFDEFNEAGEKLLDLSEEKYAQEIARAREDSQWAAKHSRYHLEKRIREEALTDKLNSARKLLAKGMSESDVVEVLGLELNQVVNLSNSEN